MSMLPKAVYKFNAISVKIPVASFTDIEQITLKFVWHWKRSPSAKAILRKNNKAVDIMLPDTK